MTASWSPLAIASAHGAFRPSRQYRKALISIQAQVCFDCPPFFLHGTAGMKSKHTQKILLSNQQRRDLELIVCRRKSAQSMVLRTKIILAGAFRCWNASRKPLAPEPYPNLMQNKFARLSPCLATNLKTIVTPSVIGQKTH